MRYPWYVTDRITQKPWKRVEVKDDKLLPDELGPLFGRLSLLLRILLRLLGQRRHILLGGVGRARMAAGSNGVPWEGAGGSGDGPAIRTRNGHLGGCPSLAL